MDIDVTGGSPVAPVGEVVVYPISEETRQRTTMNLAVVHGPGGE